MIAQRPGFTAPTLLARQLATLDQLSGGRVSLHVITGGNATELRQDGNTLDDKDERYARTSEFLDIVRAEWTSEKPFDYNGKYYKVEKGFSQIKPHQPGGIYTFVGGGSDAAIEVAGKHADTFALWGESYAQVRDVTSRVRAAAARHGRPTPRTPEDLSAHQCIVYSRMSPAQQWAFDSEHGRHVASINGPIHVDDADAMQEATMHHLGIAILPEWNAAEGLRSGELEHVLPDYTIAALPLHAVYPETQWMSLRARSFLDLLVERAEHFAPAPSHTRTAGAGG